MNRIGIQLVVMFVAFIGITGCVYWVLGHFAGSKLPRCPDDGWPVETYGPAGFGKVLGKDAERTDEKELRLWCSQAALELGSGAYALQLRNPEYARELIRTHGGDVGSIRLIMEAY